MVFRIIILLAGLTAIPCNAEFRDPTQPAYPPPSTAAADAVVDIELVLSAIWISSHSRRATINGVSVKQGQTITIEQAPTEPASAGDKKDEPLKQPQQQSAVDIRPRPQMNTALPQKSGPIPVHSNTIRIISIHKNSVTIDQNGKIKTLHLVQRSYKTH